MKKLSVIVLLLASLSGLVSVWWNKGVGTVNPKDKTARIFVIEKGQGVRDIAKKLKEEGFIKDPVVFFLLVKKLGLDGEIQAGDFRLCPCQTAERIARELTHGTLDIWVTVPEGYRAEEVTELLSKKVPSYATSWQKELSKYEGYLFPDTYLIPKDADVTLIIRIMRENFDRKYQTLTPANGRLSKEEIVTVASLVEREARFPEDRPLVASVISNRLSLGMKLDIDATIQYALGYQEKEKRWWKQHLTREDLSLDSPYNTYQNAGLPPTPIANPGLAALRAVMSPAKTNYLYYVSDKNGRNHYAETIEEHNANIKKYGL